MSYELNVDRYCMNGQHITNLGVHIKFHLILAAELCPCIVDYFSTLLAIPLLNYVSMKSKEQRERIAILNILFMATKQFSPHLYVV